jgi:hypothetical protein
MSFIFCQILYKRSFSYHHPYLVWLEYGLAFVVVVALVARRRAVLGVLAGVADCMAPAVKKVFCALCQRRPSRK